jgi:hypothetical protein
MSESDSSYDSSAAGATIPALPVTIVGLLAFIEKATVLSAMESLFGAGVVATGVTEALWVVGLFAVGVTVVYIVAAVALIGSGIVKRDGALIIIGVLASLFAGLCVGIGTYYFAALPVLVAAWISGSMLIYGGLLLFGGVGLLAVIADM